MNSINDVLNQKADDLFKNDPLTPKIDIDIEVEKPKITATTPDLNQLKTLVYSLKDQLEAIIRLLNNETSSKTNTEENTDIILATGEKIIEGVFNGLCMIGPDGKEYPVPPNYSSKSKLVEGDMMKLTITKNGSFVFKQIGPIERKRLVGELISSPEGQWSTLIDNKNYKLLTASVTFYKGKIGDEVVILVPTNGSSDWAAVENVIRR